VLNTEGGTNLIWKGDVKAAGPRIPLPGAVANLLTLVLRAIAVRGIMEHRFVVRLDSLVAFASRVLQPLDVDNGDMAAAICDEAGLLECASYERNTWPAHPII
jgi:hypothetical protein